MPFVKLDCAILTSTIWDDCEARIVFLTALLMAEPREFTEAVPQIHVRKIENTGWCAPPGWYGFVPAAGSGIVRRAGGISTDDGLDALERLGAPEQESRSQEFDGRRLIRVNGGYLVLNYDKYRERDYGAAERVRRYRKRKRETRNGNGETRNVTQAEVEVEVEDRRRETTETSSPPSPRAHEAPNFEAAAEIYATIGQCGMSTDPGEQLVVAWLGSYGEELIRETLQDVAPDLRGKSWQYLRSIIEARHADPSQRPGNRKRRVDSAARADLQAGATRRIRTPKDFGQPEGTREYLRQLEASDTCEVTPTADSVREVEWCTRQEAWHLAVKRETAIAWLAHLRDNHADDLSAAPSLASFAIAHHVEPLRTN